MADDFLVTFLASILYEQGVKDAREIARKAAADLRKSRMVSEVKVDRAERYKTIYDLRTGKSGQPLDPEIIEDRLGCSPSTVKRAIRAELLIRRG